MTTLEHTCEVLGINLVSDEVQMIDGARLPGIVARRPFHSGLFPFSPLRPMLIVNVTTVVNRAAAATLLTPLFTHDHPVRVVIRSERLETAETTIGLLADMAGAQVIFVPASDPLLTGADPRAFQHVIARLRDVDGCPWDRKQTHQSLRDSFIDEVYEVVDAIDADDPANLAEELGDLFLLIVMHAQIASESGTFTIEQVYRDVTAKIVGRHPHVFADADATGRADLLRIWNDAKAKERAERPRKGGAKAADGEPHSMPGLTRAVRVLEKHPRVPDRLWDATDSAESMLDLVSGMIANGDDPETLLREALTRHVHRSADRLNDDIDI